MQDMPGIMCANSMVSSVSNFNSERLFFVLVVVNILQNLF